MKKLLTIIIVFMTFNCFAQEFEKQEIHWSRQMTQHSMGGGGDLGGTGYIATTLSTEQIEAINLIRNSGDLVAIGGGGDMGGTGKTVDFIVVNGMIVDLRAINVQNILANKIIFQASEDEIEDIELKNGDFISSEDIQIAPISRIAIPAKDVKNLFLTSGIAIQPNLSIVQNRN